MEKKIFVMDGGLYGEAYNNAIRAVIDEVNAALGTDLFYVRDWAAVDMLAEKLGVRFNEDGEIIREV